MLLPSMKKVHFCETNLISPSQYPYRGDNCIRNRPYGPISYVYASFLIVGRAPLPDWPYPNMRLLNQDQQLELSSVSMSQEGDYSCKVTNPAGRDRQQFHLTVLCKYIFQSFKSKQQQISFHY